MSVAVEYVAMRDGVRLATDVYLPESAGDGQSHAGPWPVLIIRTPYRRAGLGPFRAICASGYALIVQDVRGTGDSGGTFGFLAQEPADALDTANWLLEQGWCDGRFGLIGISYLAGASIAIAAEMPERVKACVWVTMPVSREWLSYESGALRLHHALPWAMLVSGRTLGGLDWRGLYGSVPLRAAASDLPFWQTLCNSEADDAEFWQQNDLSHYLDRLRAPGLHFAGWYDFLNDASFEPYERLTRTSGAPQRLIVGPYSHNGIVGNADGCGEIHYGDVARPRFAEQATAWFNRWFKGAPLDRETGVRAFLPGDGGGWVELPEWGSGEARQMHLAPSGRLQSTPPDAASAMFGHDPHNPVPTVGGAVWEFPGAHVGLEPGPALQTTAGRPDILVFDTDQLAEGLTVCGPSVLTLHVATSATSTDFTAKLCDVAPDGTSRFICDGIVRARFTPGETRPLEITMVCGHVFAVGHRMRLEVASSNFPKYDRNPGSGQSAIDATPSDYRVARQTVLLGPSRLGLIVQRT